MTFAQAQQIVAARCQPCHSLHPTQAGFTAPPAGIAFDTPAQIHELAGQIRLLAVATTTMPLGNVTNMTRVERDLLGQWIASGAKIAP